MGEEVDQRQVRRMPKSMEGPSGVAYHKCEVMPLLKVAPSPPSIKSVKVRLWD